jgi:hypothetical protein
MEEAKKVKVLVGVPHMGIFPYQTVASMLNLIGATKYPNSFALLGLSLVYVAREDIVKNAIDNGFTHVFFLDSDMNPPSNIINKLVEQDKDIISGMAFKRVFPFEPCFYDKIEETSEGKCLRIYRDWEKDSLIEVVGVGMACCLIKIEVFKKLYETIDKIYFPRDETGEDIGFCQLATRAGYKIYVDTSIDVGHVSSFESNSTRWEACKNADNRNNVSEK